MNSDPVKTPDLAVHAGPEPIAPWPWYGPDERGAVDAVLASGKVNYWTGQETRRFEEEYSKFLGVRRTIALANGTLALELALRAWGIGPGDEVVVTPRSFIASVSCVVLLGARPVFADVDRDSGNVTPASVAAVLTPRTRAILPVHLGGWPCDMDGFMELARERNLKVLEDCAQAHGGALNGTPVGAFGDAAAFSFCQDKIITTLGEGGLLATRDEQLWDWAWSYKDHGKTWESMYVRQHAPAPAFRWVHDRFGTNWRLTEPQGAVGRLQLAKLAGWVSRRQLLSKIYDEAFAEVPALRIPEVPKRVAHARYKYYAYLRPERLRAGWTRDRIAAEIAARGAPCFAGSCSEIYRENAFDGSGFRPKTPLPVAHELGETSLMFLVHPTLSDDAVNAIAHSASAVLRQALR